MVLKWLIFAILVGWCWPIFLPWWWWWWWRRWWPWPRPPLPDPPPYERIPFDWIAHVSGAVGGGVAWAVLGRDLAPDGGLLSLVLVSLVGAAALGSAATGLGSLGQRDVAKPSS